LREAIFEHWKRRFGQTGGKGRGDWRKTLQRGKRYAAGFMNGAGARVAVSPVPLHRKAAAVVYAGTDEKTILEVLSQLDALPLHEIVIVAGNPTESLFAIARGFEKALVIGLPEPVAPDIGRALGAKLTGADTVLFVDGDRVVGADLLARFLWECEGKLDVALNDLNARIGSFRQRKEIDRLNEFLNASLRREDLRINSLATLPFALSRQALNALGASALSVPAKAHAQAILKGLRIGPAGFVSSGGRLEKFDAEWRVAAGDYAEALREAFNVRGSRMHFKDRMRNRDLLEGGEA